MRSRLIGAVSALLAACLSGTPALAASSHEFQSPRRYYLALGDSLAFGYQYGKFLQEVATGTYDPATFNTGYVDDFAARLREIRPEIQTVNLGCPGETTASYMAACLYEAGGFALHVPYEGSQEAAALNFIAVHPRQVSPITLTLGANDFINLRDSCHFDPTCIAGGFPAVVTQLSTNLERILSELRAAAPGGEIIVMQYYNAYALIAPFATTFVLAVNAVIAQVAQANGARVADAFTPFKPETLCTFTFVCTPLQDTHASDAGYRVIADQFWAASSYPDPGEGGDQVE
jgi:lysophospholipase L1-like esterase